MLGLEEEIRCSKLFRFTEEAKRKIVEEYLASGLSKREIWEKYTGCKREHGKIVEWMRQYDYNHLRKEKSSTFASQKGIVKEEEKKQALSESEIFQLQKHNAELERQLRESRIASIAWQTMVELAEKEFGISIKKKFNTKPSKK